MAQVNSPSANKNKKSEYFKIGTFNIKRKTVYRLAVIGLAIFIYSEYKSAQDAKELQARLDEQERLRALAGGYEDAEVWDYDEALRRKLHDMYGEPPEGFEWNVSGELVALSTSDLTYEEVTYSFVRALSILDFATAQRVSRNSSVIDEYNDYYGVSTVASYADYYDSFLRKQYRLSLTSIEINQIDYTSIAADGTAVVTLNINCLDLTDKDFWRGDQDELFKEMLVFDETESDSVKKEQYLYDYIYQAYENGVVGKHTVVVDLVVSKDNASGWLVSNDNELRQVLMYEAGTNVASYILSEYSDYRVEKLIENNLHDNGSSGTSGTAVLPEDELLDGIPKQANETYEEYLERVKREQELINQRRREELDKQSNSEDAAIKKKTEEDKDDEDDEDDDDTEGNNTAIDNDEDYTDINNSTAESEKTNPVVLP